MTEDGEGLSTGLPGLDRVIGGVFAGDNIVWQVDDIDDYVPFVEAFCREAHRRGQKLIYFRFARHAPLLPPDVPAETHTLHPEVGFESFTAAIHEVIRQAGRGACYVFDSLSDLAADWYSDLMVGNFFRVTCPYLYEWETVTYFALLRHRHSFHAVASIRDTTQLLLDVHRHGGRLYVHPLKVWQRYSPTMYLPHVWDGGEFRPVTESALIADLLSAIAQPRVDTAARTLDLWDRTFLDAEDVLAQIRSGDRPPEEAAEWTRRLLRMAVSRDERLFELAARYLTLEDVLQVRKRMIGTGLIGGKSVGMLVARAVLTQANPRWRAILEAHDSFYIGSDVFYSYLVANGCWEMRRDRRDLPLLLERAEAARERILGGTFPEFIRHQFVEMLDYFGQSPIVVRSSSLLEDSFGNAFAGKYESVFCTNQGSPQERLNAFMDAVRQVYASTVSPEALLYRARQGLLDRDEQMALLVQRVSGAYYGRLFFPQIAGVGLSFNPFAWSEHIDPSAGVLRIVFGLGTRAVHRSDDDYTRIVGLSAPTRRPEASLDEVRSFAQRRVDVLDLEQRRLVSRSFDEVARAAPGVPLDVLASYDQELVRHARERGARNVFPWVLTFDRLLSATPFVADMREMLSTLEAAYQQPVDIEFTANFLDDGSYRINLVQCRPLQVRWGDGITDPPADIPESDILLQTRGVVIGRSRAAAVDRIIYVSPALYGQLPLAQRYTVADVVGRAAKCIAPDRTLLLVGPGRWGTTMPSLGVPVSFAHISTVSILCEVVAMRDDLVPDVSLGTHFFNDLVENDVLYLALFPGSEGAVLNTSFLEGARNRLPDLLPECACWSEIIRVVDAADLPRRILVHANALTQRAVCYLEPSPGA